MLRRLFFDHPHAVGESYGEHALTASRVGFTLVAAGLACFVHAAVPALFTSTGSDTIRRLHARLGVRKDTADRRGVDGQPIYDI